MDRWLYGQVAAMDKWVLWTGGCYGQVAVI